MKFAQLNLNGSYNRTLETFDQIEVTEGTTKSVSQLTDEEKLELRLYPIVPTTVPAFDPRSHWLREIEPKFINSICTQQWQVLDLPAEQAQTNFATTKHNKRLQINDWRAQANQTSFTYAGKQIESDALSRSDIDGVMGSIALTGDFPAGFPNAWKALDNTYVAIPTVQSFKDMYSAMTLQGTINFGKAQQLKAELAAATTLAEIDAVIWE